MVVAAVIKTFLLSYNVIVTANVAIQRPLSFALKCYLYDQRLKKLPGHQWQLKILPTNDFPMSMHEMTSRRLILIQSVAAQRKW
jgi:hypothetical protein